MNYLNIVNSAKNLIYISLICTFLTLLLSKSKFLSSVKFICGVTVLITALTVITPFVNSLGQLINIDFSFEDSESTDNELSENLIIEQSASYICEYVKTLISQKYGISEENISTSVTLDSSNIENVIIKNVTLSFKNTEEGLYSEIAKYVSDVLGCECTVISK